jgi:IclR family transcriptional regulator, pca regulon regulatory protein
VTTTTRKKPAKTKQRDLISSLERGFRVLRVFDQFSAEMTPSEVARKTELPRAATRRVLLTLCDLGYAISDGKYFRLTPKVLDLAHGYLAKTRIRYLIDPVMHDAVNAINDSCVVAIRDGADEIAIACYNSTGFGAVSVSLGLRIPLYVSTPGRVMLANLSAPELADYLASIKLEPFTNRTVTSKRALREQIIKIREDGYAVGREEFEVGVYAVAVPLKTRSGRLVAAITCIGNVARIQAPEALESRIKILSDAAERLSQMLPDSVDITTDLEFSTRS